MLGAMAVLGAMAAPLPVPHDDMPAAYLPSLETMLTPSSMPPPGLPPSSSHMPPPPSVPMPYGGGSSAERILGRLQAHLEQTVWAKLGGAAAPAAPSHEAEATGLGGSFNLVELETYSEREQARKEISLSREELVMLLASASPFPSPANTPINARRVPPGPRLQKGT